MKQLTFRIPPNSNAYEINNIQNYFRSLTIVNHVEIGSNVFDCMLIMFIKDGYTMSDIFELGVLIANLFKD